MNHEPNTPVPQSTEVASRILLRRIAEVRQGLIEIRRNRFLAIAISLAAVVSAALWLALASRIEVRPITRSMIHIGLFVLALITWWWGSRNQWSNLEIARRVEAARPDLNMGLITAVEKLGATEATPSYLTEKLFDQTVVRAAKFDWNAVTTRKGRRNSSVLLGFVIAALLVSEGGLVYQMWPKTSGATLAEASPDAPPQKPSETLWQVEVTPGNAEIEKGSRVVFEAKFSGAIPPEAVLVSTSTPESEPHQLPMGAGIEGAVFGAVMGDVTEDLTYHIEASGHSSEDFHLTTFEYPTLVQTDLTITPPAYTGDAPKTMKKAMKATVLEGSSIQIDIEVNKPLADAELFGEDESIVPLSPVPGDSTHLTATVAPKESIKYRVHLVDDADRANRNPPWIDLKVRANQLPKIEVVFPKRDIQVSPIQELPLEAKVSDDLSVQKSGLVYTLAGNTQEVLFEHAATKPKKTETVRSILKLEEHAAEPRQLLSYYFWAEDEGPAGEARRAMSDMFFAEVRHFEDIFREAEAPPPQPGEPKQASDELVSLQKEITNANWRIIRDISGGKKVEDATDDIGVVAESQEIALNMVKEAMEKSEDPELSEALSQAWKSMRDALDPLQQARNEAKRSPLNQALGFEQSALEWLQRAQSREHQVARQNQPPPGGAGAQKQKEELAALELKQDDQRYEEEREASPEASAEQQESLQVLARLKELARRQEALAKKMQELQDQLRNAESEEEKQELASQLKQLQEEQEQLLKDLDDLGQKMDEATDPAKMAEARDQLDETREQVLDAAEQLEEQKLTEAAQSATRAQRQLKAMEEDFRKRTSSEFADEAKRLRQDARDLAEAQNEIHKTLDDQPAAKDGPFDDPAEALQQKLKGAELARALEDQAKKLDELLDGVRTLSEQAEVGEPLLSRKLYEAVREAQTRGLEENLDDARFQTKYGARQEALESERQAAQAMEQLSKDIADAAETVLGSEAEALRMARTELDRLIDEADQELKQLSNQKGDPQMAGEPKESQEGKGQGESSEASESGSGKPSNESDAKTADSASSSKKGQSDQPSDSSKKGEGKGKGKGQTPGESTSQEMAQAGEGQSPEGAPTGKGKGPGEGKGNPAGSSTPPSPGQGENGTSPEGSPSSSQSSASASPNRGGGSSGGNDRTSGGNEAGGFFFDAPTEQPSAAPITGDGYDRWADRLRTVEELLEQPELRNDAARVLDDARAMRVEANRNNAPPQVDHLEARITRPLMELRDRVVEELARQNAEDPTVPIDRDPVPPEYQDLVRRYYTELGRGQ